MSSTKRERERLEIEIKAIDARQVERQRQDAARGEWRKTPRTQGAQQILLLIEQPELKVEFHKIERTFQQLKQWYEIAASTPEVENVRATITAYLDGDDLTSQVRQTMRQALTQVQQHENQLEP